MAALTIHQVQDETQFIRSVEGICHTHYERAILQRERKRQRGSNKQDRDVSVQSEFVYVAHPGADQRQHDSLVECQRFSLLHFDPLFIQTLHGIPDTHSK